MPSSSSSAEGRELQQLTDRMGEVERLHSIVARDAAAMKAMGVLVEAKALKLDVHGKACAVSRSAGDGRRCWGWQDLVTGHMRLMGQGCLVAPCMKPCFGSQHANTHTCQCSEAMCMCVRACVRACVRVCVSGRLQDDSTHMSIDCNTATQRCNSSPG